MRLRSVYISHYKNLRDFKIDFEGEQFIDIFVGKNGCGKSNFLEALIEIFDHLYTFGGASTRNVFDYAISWEVAGKRTDVVWKDKTILINGVARKMLGQTPLPANIIVYYSGQNDTVSALIRRYRDSYRRRVRKANVADLPRFIGIGPDYKAMLLALMLMLPETTPARMFLCHKLGISGVGSKTTLTLRRPGKGIVHQSRWFDPFDDKEIFWGIAGVPRTFLDELLKCITGDFSPGGLHSRDDDTYRLEIDVAKFREIFAAVPADDVFCRFNALRVLGMIKDVSAPVRLGDAVEVTSRAFSDGQFQSIYLFAISELFKNRECVTLLDEPDAFLHPEWQYDFLSQVRLISEEATRTNHILMSSHSASTVAAKVDARLRSFELVGEVVATFKKDKAEIIESLSAGLISFSEQEARLNVHQVLDNTTGPVVFTEGITDEMIVKTAWAKLYPGRRIPFEVQGTFGCGFLGALFRDGSIFTDHPGRPFFALFDFDDAYNNWNSSNTDLIQDDVSKGLVRRRAGLPGFLILLPVPAALSVRNQVVAPSGQHFKERSSLPIELLFHDVPQLAGRFCDDPSRPGGLRKLSGNKITFAKDAVPHVAAEHFECFRPLFEFIEAQIARGNLAVAV